MQNGGNLERLVRDLSQSASTEINQALGLRPEHDQTNGNKCDLLTRYVLEALISRGFEGMVRREFHQRPDTLDWHFMLAHRGPDESPTEQDIVSDLNPWRGGTPGYRVLHGSRDFVIEQMGKANVPADQISLRGIHTIRKLHHPSAELPIDAMLK